MLSTMQLLPEMKKHLFIKTSFVYGAEISFYSNDNFSIIYAIANNGIACALKDLKDIYFYKNNICVLQTVARNTYVGPNSNIDAVTNYLEFPIFFHVEEDVAAKIFEFLKDKQNISFVLHPKEMLYFFNYKDAAEFSNQKEMGLLKYKGETYCSTTDDVKRHLTLFLFISKYSSCLFEFYESLNSNKTLFILYLKWTDVFMVYDRDSNVLTINGECRDKYKNADFANEELVSSYSLKIDKDEMLDYVYNYCYTLACEKLKPSKHYDGIDFSCNYKDTLKLFEMINI